jgi:hypothetical protein
MQIFQIVLVMLPYIFMVLLFRLGGRREDYPHPEIDWDEFISVMKTRNAEVGTTWSPKYQTMKPWILPTKLKKCYGPPSLWCAIS